MPRRSILAFLVCCAALARPAYADVTAGGAYTTSVNVEVPAFGELTPTVALTYSSDAGNGVAGIGWSLDSTSYIVRSGPHGSAATGSASDVFLLDGVELVPCAVQMVKGPSCWTGGSHSTQLESFLRIKQEGSIWIVTRKDGTKLTYMPQTVASINGVYRWALASMVDLHGREVLYNYTCDGPYGHDECYPETIRYGTAEVRFYWGNRPDSITNATGQYITRTVKRLKSIDVTVSGRRARAYSLQYNNALAQISGSVLVSVTRWANDALLDISGEVLSGTALPAELFAPSPATGQFANQGKTPTFEFGPPIDNGGSSNATNYESDTTLQWDPNYDWQRWMPGDIDGDGKTDFIGTYYFHPSQGNDVFMIRTARIDHNGAYTHNAPQVTSWVYADRYLRNWYRVFTGDFNGDG